MAEELMTTQAAVERLSRSLEQRSLKNLVRAKRRQTLLLLDVSYSMNQFCDGGVRKIDALRDVVTEVQRGRSCPMAAFFGTSVDMIDVVPEPHGGTPLAEAIEFGSAQGATHLVVVSDGEPNDKGAALAAARQFVGTIDVVYIGGEFDDGAHFLKQLAAASGGGCSVADLGTPKQLVSKLAGLLTA